MEDFAVKINPFTYNLTFHLQKLSGDFPKKARTEELSFRVQQIIDRISGIVNVQLSEFPIFRGIFEMTMTMPMYEEVYQEILASSRAELQKAKDPKGEKEIPKGWADIENFGGKDFLQGTKSKELLDEVLGTLLNQVIERTQKANEALQEKKNDLIRALAAYNPQEGESLNEESQKNIATIEEALKRWKWRSTSEMTARLFGDKCAWDEESLSLEVADGSAHDFYLRKMTFAEALKKVTDGAISNGKGGSMDQREAAKKEMARPLLMLRMKLILNYD